MRRALEHWSRDHRDEVRIREQSKDARYRKHSPNFGRLGMLAILGFVEVPSTDGVTVYERPEGYMIHLGLSMEYIYCSL